MSYILEAVKKSSKTDWQNNKEMKLAASSPESEKGRAQADNKIRETYRQDERKSNNSSVREQIFHPVDRIF